MTQNITIDEILDKLEAGPDFCLRSNAIYRLYVDTCLLYDLPVKYAKATILHRIQKRHPHVVSAQVAGGGSIYYIGVRLK